MFGNELFSNDFFRRLKQQVKPNSKTSKALIDALKQLRNIDINNKKKILQLQTQVKSLKEQNQMLMQMLEESKNDLSLRLKSKQQKIKQGIQTEAKLYSQNQSLKNQIQNLKEHLRILKNHQIQSQKSLTILKSCDDMSRMSLQKNEDQELYNYLYKSKQCLVQESINNKQQNQNNVSIDHQVKELDKKLLQNHQQGDQTYKSETNLQTQAFLSRILHG